MTTCPGTDDFYVIKVLSVDLSVQGRATDARSYYPSLLLVIDWVTTAK